MRLVLPVFLTLFSAFSLPAAADDAPGQTPEERRLRTDRLAAEGHCRAKRRAYDDARERLDKALSTETPEMSIYFRAQELERARENYCLCLAQIWNAANPGKPLPKEWEEYCDPRPPFDIETARRERGIGAPPPRGAPQQPGAPPDMSDAPVDCTERYEAYVENRREFQASSRGGRAKGDGAERTDRPALRQKLVASYRSLCDCWKDRATDLYEEHCTWSGQGPPPDLSLVGSAPPGSGQPPAKNQPDAPLPDPPQPVSPAAPGSGPAPPGPGMPAPPGPGMPAADCLRDGAWNVTFTVETHNDNHDHTVCVRFLRRLLQMTLGDFLGDLFAARFEDLLPRMECARIPGCSGSCKGTLPQFAGQQNVQFEIQQMRRSADTLTGRLVITSGGQTLFILRFTATPAVTA